MGNSVYLEGLQEEVDETMEEVEEIMEEAEEIGK